MKKTYQQPMAYIENMESEQILADSPLGKKIGDGYADTSLPGLSRVDVWGEDEEDEE